MYNYVETKQCSYIVFTFVSVRQLFLRVATTCKRYWANRFTNEITCRLSRGEPFNLYNGFTVCLLNTLINLFFKAITTACKCR